MFVSADYVRLAQFQFITNIVHTSKIVKVGYKTSKNQKCFHWCQIWHIVYYFYGQRARFLLIND